MSGEKADDRLYLRLIFGDSKMSAIEILGIGEAYCQMGWQLYATNQPQAHLRLDEAMTLSLILGSNFKLKRDYFVWS